MKKNIRNIEILITSCLIFILTISTIFAFGFDFDNFFEDDNEYDINNDDFVDENDALMFSNLLGLGEDYSENNFDIDHNGVVDEQDIKLMLVYSGNRFSSSDFNLSDYSYANDDSSDNLFNMNFFNDGYFDNLFNSNQRYDLDNDGEVDESDVLLVLESLGFEGDYSDNDLDFNNDNLVNEGDVEVLLEVLGRTGFNAGTYSSPFSRFGNSFFDRDDDIQHIDLDLDDGIKYESVIIRI